MSKHSSLNVTVTFKREEIDDDSPDVSYLEQDCFNAATEGEENYGFKRIEAFKRGDWYMLGIRAVAIITIARPGHSTTYKLKSPGLWGIESDSDEAYRRSVFKEECNTLQADIEALKGAEFIL